MRFMIQVMLLLMSWEISARISSKMKNARLSLAEPMNSLYYNRIDGQEGTYGFGYDVSDSTSGSTQFRKEERYPNGTVVGSYGFLDPNGKPHRYRYIADHKGYRVMRERPFTLSSPAIKNQSSSSNQETNEITWTRKKNNNTIVYPYLKRKLGDRKFMQYPFKYFHQ